GEVGRAVAPPSRGSSTGHPDGIEMCSVVRKPRHREGPFEHGDVLRASIHARAVPFGVLRAAVAGRVTERLSCAVCSRRLLPSGDLLGVARVGARHRRAVRVDAMRVSGFSALAAAVAGGLGYQLVVSGALTLDTGVGRTLRSLGPFAVTIAA